MGYHVSDRARARAVLLIMVITYSMQALDKGTISFVSIMKLPEDTNLNGQEFSWLTTCIYIAILVFKYPTNSVLQRVPIGKYLAFNIPIPCGTSDPNKPGRSPTGKGIQILLAAPYLPSNALRYMMNGGQQIVGGLLAYCFSLIESGPLKSWQAIFIAYGGVTVFWGIFVWCWMPDSPMRAKCFMEADKRLMVECVRENQTGLQNMVFRREQAIEALLDPQTWGYCLISICTTLPTSGIGAFKSNIISGFHFTVLQTQLLAMVLGAYIILILFSSLYIVKKTGQSLVIMGVYVIQSFIGTIVMMTVKNTNPATRIGLLISYYIALSSWSAQTLALSMISRNVTGMTKKSVLVAANFISWATAAAIGPQVFLSWDAPRYSIAFATHLGCYTMLVIVICALRWHLKRENAKKDAVQTGNPNLSHAFEDLTDRENPEFRYIF
ncbi:major facilitator superfamily domain-containing protein [Hypoxylon crocopeplum]|nr:major facilitator superfamily domain-containing protein [Hypoxylon crocopeplum]